MSAACSYTVTAEGREPSLSRAFNHLIQKLIHGTIDALIAPDHSISFHVDLDQHGGWLSNAAQPLAQRAASDVNSSVTFACQSSRTVLSGKSAIAPSVASLDPRSLLWMHTLLIILQENRRTPSGPRWTEGIMSDLFSYHISNPATPSPDKVSDAFGLAVAWKVKLLSDIFTISQEIASREGDRRALLMESKCGYMLRSTLIKNSSYY